MTVDHLAIIMYKADVWWNLQTLWSLEMVLDKSLGLLDYSSIFIFWKIVTLSFFLKTAEYLSLSVIENKLAQTNIFVHFSFVHDTCVNYAAFDTQSLFIAFL